MPTQIEVDEKVDELLSLLDGNAELAINALRNRAVVLPSKPQNEPSLSPSTAPVLISTRDLIKAYKIGQRTAHAVSGVSLDIREREVVAITGASGSGKSTLLQLIGSLDKPTSGQVVVDGKDISKLGDAHLSIFRNRTIGFVFQFFYLQPFLTLAKNIEVPAMPCRMPTSERQQRTSELLDAVGLTRESDHLPSQLSGGQIQRAAIARALYNHPKIILADEPTGNLDSQNSRMVVNLLLKVREHFGTTILIVTHDHSIAAQADRTLTIADGKLT